MNGIKGFKRSLTAFWKIFKVFQKHANNFSALENVLKMEVSSSRILSLGEINMKKQMNGIMDI